MIGSLVDSLLARFSARQRNGTTGNGLLTRIIHTPAGGVRVHDSGTEKPCVVLVPDGPNVIEHCKVLIDLLSPRLRVVCFDMPGFGFSFPPSSYEHSLDHGAQAVLGVLDSLGIRKATLAFSCANGFLCLARRPAGPAKNLQSGAFADSVTDGDACLDKPRSPVAIARSGRGPGPGLVLPQKGRTGVVQHRVAENDIATAVSGEGARRPLRRSVLLPGRGRSGAGAGNDGLPERHYDPLHNDMGGQRPLPQAHRANVPAGACARSGNRALRRLRALPRYRTA